jgi:hypothetical protein
VQEQQRRRRPLAGRHHVDLAHVRVAELSAHRLHSGSSRLHHALRVRSRAYTDAMQRALVVAGLVILAIGLLWPWLGKLPLGRLPGDLVIDRPGFRLFVPFTTMIVVSLLLSLLFWLFRR